MPTMTPVGNTIIPPDPMRPINTLSGILGLKQQRLALQTGQAKLGTAQAKEQSQQIATQGQTEASQFFKSWNPLDHLAPDGSTDIASATQSPEFQSAGPGKPIIEQALLGIKSNQLANKTALAGLNSTLLTQFGTVVGSLAKDPDIENDKVDSATGVNAGRMKVEGAINNWGKLSPDSARIAQLYAPMVEHAPPGKLQDSIAALQMQAQSASEQQKAQFPGFATIGLGGKTLKGTITPSTGQFTRQGEELRNTLPPQVILNPLTEGPAVVGGSAGTNPQPIGGGPSGGGRSNPWQPYAGEKGDIAQYQGEVQTTRQAADQAPLVHNINQQILRLASDSRTGPGSEIWQHAVGALSAPFGLSPTANYQELGKFLEKNAINNMQAMGGPPSDARLSAAAAANGSTTFSPEALKAVTRFNDATTTGLTQYRQGIDNFIGTRNPDYTKLPDFKKAWAKNFDVNVFAVENAIKEGDQGELARIKSQVGSAGLKALAAKRKALVELTNGELPQ